MRGAPGALVFGLHLPLPPPPKDQEVTEGINEKNIFIYDTQLHFRNFASISKILIITNIDFKV